MDEATLRQKLSRCTVGIAGCGGLGSNCAVALARVGIGNLVLVDFDNVEASNLNRQYYFRTQIGLPKVEALRDNIALIDPEVKVQPHQVRLTARNIPLLFHGCDVVVEAFDLADQKQMMMETMMETMPEIPLVSGVGMAGWGKSNLIHVEQYGNIIICGDQQTETSATTPSMAPRVGIVANMQANCVLEVLLLN